MRAAHQMRRPPRAWQRMQDSIEEEWLTDQAWLLERVDVPGATNHGTPTVEDREFGPYAAKLAEPVEREQRQPDREVLEGSYALTVASDREPQERQAVRVVTDKPGLSGIYRIEGTVNPRPAPWGTSPLYNVEVNRTEAY
jgi:hypothetical protein